MDEQGLRPTFNPLVVGSNPTGLTRIPLCETTITAHLSRGRIVPSHCGIDPTETLRPLGPSDLTFSYGKHSARTGSRASRRFYNPFPFPVRYDTTGVSACMYRIRGGIDMGKRLVRFLGGIGLAGLLLALTVAPVAAAAMVARVVGSGIQFDGSGFYPGELVQVTGVRYDGSTLPFGTAMANPVGAITGIVPYADTALSQIDARGYASGMHAVSNITGALPYPVVPPGYPYVGPTYPYYTVVVPGALPTNGGYANTGYPYTGAPYGGFSPGAGFQLPRAIERGDSLSLPRRLSRCRRCADLRLDRSVRGGGRASHLYGYGVDAGRAGRTLGDRAQWNQSVAGSGHGRCRWLNHRYHLVRQPRRVAPLRTDAGDESADQRGCSGQLKRFS